MCHGKPSMCIHGRRGFRIYSHKIQVKSSMAPLFSLAYPSFHPPVATWTKRRRVERFIRITFLFIQINLLIFVLIDQNSDVKNHKVY